MKEQDAARHSGSGTKKLTVNKTVCTRCGTCIAMYPEIFEFSEDGTVQVKEKVKIEDSNVEEIKSICPVDAIEDSG